MSKEKQSKTMTADMKAESTIDNNDREYKKKMSRQTVMTVAMILVSVFVISVATYAWYLISNAPKITGMEFKADTIGDLWISDSSYLKSGGDLEISCADSWGNELNLSTSAGYNLNSGGGAAVSGKGDYGIYQGLSPVTTNNGTSFYRPIYTNNVVTGTSEVNPTTERTLLNTKYVYEKTFWLRAGDGNNVTGSNKYYNIYLVGKTDTLASDASVGESFAGTFLRTKQGTSPSANANNTDGAENALRVSFEFESGKTYQVDYTKKDESAYTANNASLVRIYEPNADTHNTAGTDAQKKKALSSAGDGVLYDYSEVPYATIKQLFSKSFLVVDGDNYVSNAIKNYTPFTTPNAYDMAGQRTKSPILCTIKENQPVKVVLRVWLEGSDADCVNGIAAKEIMGQIQFVSEENYAQYGAKNTNESSTAYDTPSYFGGVANYVAP